LVPGPYCSITESRNATSIALNSVLVSHCALIFLQIPSNNKYASLLQPLNEVFPPREFVHCADLFANHLFK
jgi:hypothetical protein